MGVARRWLFHLVRPEDLGWGRDGRYSPASLAREGFIHASFKAALTESAALYFKPDELPRLRVMAIDPRRLDVPIEIADTPRGPMPHIHGSVPVDAVHVIDLDAVETHADTTAGTRIALVAFEGMTLLDLVGPLDALSRIASMGFDATTTCEVIALTRPREASDLEPPVVWSAWGAELVTARYRPSLESFDVLVVAGGPGTRVLEKDERAMAWLSTFPTNRIIASVCTGSLLLGAAGRLRGKHATTHRTMLKELARFGAISVPQRVVDEGQLITSGGVTSGIELGLHLVRRLAGDEAHATIAAQMEVLPDAPPPPIGGSEAASGD
jgi:cyclohexyl-isocyanide hydratase